MIVEGDHKFLSTSTIFCLQSKRSLVLQIAIAPASNKNKAIKFVVCWKMYSEKVHCSCKRFVSLCVVELCILLKLVNVVLLELSMSWQNTTCLLLGSNGRWDLCHCAATVMF